MLGFTTRNSEYFIDEGNKLIWGGALDRPEKYKRLVIIKDMPAFVTFEDGRFLRTSAIVKFNSLISSDDFIKQERVR